MGLDLERLRARLESPTSHDAPDGTELAAVLVPFVEDGGAWSLVFTRRSDELSRHSGEISFPGGRVDDGESARDAALREAHEELGIDPTTVDLIGALPEALTVVSGYHISPWVGVIPNTDFQPNPREIADVIVVPLTEVTAPGVRREQRFIRAGSLMTNPAYDVGPNTIWGATARILTDLLDLLAGTGATNE